MTNPDPQTRSEGPTYPQVIVKLTGRDGNAFAIMTTNAILAYGYDLGTPDTLHGKPTSTDDDCWPQNTFSSDAVRVLYNSIPGLPDYDTAFEPQETVADTLGVRIRYYASSESGCHILATAVLTVDSADTMAIDPAAMLADPGRGRWNDQLAHALNVLGLTPLRQQPGWLLAADSD